MKSPAEMGEREGPKEFSEKVQWALSEVLLRTSERDQGPTQQITFSQDFPSLPGSNLTYILASCCQPIVVVR